MLHDIICTNCKKLLLKLVQGEGEIKCKCGNICTFKVVGQKSLNEEIYA